MTARLPKRAWQRLSAGEGAKGHRFYDWTWVGLVKGPDEPAGHRWLLVRRHRRTGELGYFRCYATGRAPLAMLVRVAGRRWTVEESFQTAKGLAHLFLAITTAAERASPVPAEMITLTRNEIRHSFIRLVIVPTRHPLDCLRWSEWRRRHQYRARQAHYQRQADQER